MKLTTGLMNANPTRMPTSTPRAERTRRRRKSSRRSRSETSPSSPSNTDVERDAGDRLLENGTKDMTNSKYNLLPNPRGTSPSIRPPAWPDRQRAHRLPRLRRDHHAP